MISYAYFKVYVRKRMYSIAGLGGTDRELGAHRARVFASTDRRLLEMGSESVSASSTVDGFILVWSCLRMGVSFPCSSLTVHGIYGGVMPWSLSLRAAALAGKVWQPLHHALSCTWGPGAGISNAALKSATWGPWLLKGRWPVLGALPTHPAYCFVLYLL